MSHIRHRISSGAVLLASAVIWLMSVTLCSTGTIADESHDAAEVMPVGHAEHSHSPSHHEGKDDDGCGCKSFNAFTANTAALTKAPLPSASLPLYSIPAELFTFDSFSPPVAAKGTAPPGRMEFDDFILRQCRFNHAPPLAA